MVVYSWTWELCVNETYLFLDLSNQNITMAVIYILICEIKKICIVIFHK